MYSFGVTPLQVSHQLSCLAFNSCPLSDARRYRVLFPLSWYGFLLFLLPLSRRCFPGSLCRCCCVAPLPIIPCSLVNGLGRSRFHPPSPSPLLCVPFVSVLSHRLSLTHARERRNPRKRMPACIFFFRFFCCDVSVKVCTFACVLVRAYACLCVCVSVWVWVYHGKQL